MGYVVILITAPQKNTKDIAEVLLQEKLVACVNIIEEISSMYWWQGKIEKDKEGLLILKTKEELIDKLIERVKEIHPYTVPEIIALPIIKGNNDYLNWIDESILSG
jgi:periplasmic divalent cation tolerance protein